MGSGAPSPPIKEPRDRKSDENVRRVNIYRVRPRGVTSGSARGEVDEVVFGRGEVVKGLGEGGVGGWVG